MDGSAGSPGSHLPNWRPASTAEDYLRNCREGLEKYSERRLAELMGWPRIRIHRAKLMGELPEALFERLLAAGLLSAMALANVAIALKGDPLSGEIARCPHCGEVLRVRPNLSKKARAVIKAWLDEFDADPGTKSEIKSPTRVQLSAGKPLENKGQCSTRCITRSSLTEPEYPPLRPWGRRGSGSPGFGTAARPTSPSRPRGSSPRACGSSRAGHLPLAPQAGREGQGACNLCMP
jgi:hypothetical protein